MEIVLDNWQKEVLNCPGNLVLRSGRQVGKSFIIGIKAAEYALKHKNKLIMVISKTEKQAYLLFQKILINLMRIRKKAIRGGKFKPTKHIINLINGSTIYCLASGETGYGLMGYTIDLLIADEAAFIPECVWNSIIPALAITRGHIWLLSTPFLKEGYYYSCFSDPTFTAFHTSSEDCPRRDEAFLAHKRATLTKAEYAQMYLGQFVDELRRLFSDELIDRTCTGKRRPEIMKKARYYLGCDVARMDRDEFTFEIIDRTDKGRLIHVENIVTRNVPIPQSTRKIIELNRAYDFRKEYIDSGGMGITVCDLLREDDDNKRKVVEINNASRPYDKDGRERKIIKEELYMNLKRLMERREIQLLDDDNVKNSLKCIQVDTNKDTGRMSITGRYSHITEGLIRAVWCVKDKSLNIWVY